MIDYSSFKLVDSKSKIVITKFTITRPTNHNSVLNDIPGNRIQYEEDLDPDVKLEILSILKEAIEHEMKILEE